LTADLGAEAALGAMDVMNQSATSTTRDDGYVQDLASQWVAEAVGAGPGDLVLDMCAAPGGKATAIASTGARVIASDMRETRSGLVAENATKLGLAADRFSVIAADGTSSPFRSGTFDRVLLDAPCSGLGALRRRPDARWRINPEDIATLKELQKQLLGSALDLVKPGGEVIYSVCTLTRAESIEIDEWLTETRPDVVAVDPPDAPWIPAGRGALLLPQAEGTDGMYILKLRRLEIATEATS
jgi:16S rRNA (cytosine967-C5)-methyltransferase